MGIGKRIREARLQKHMTQQELSRLLGVTKAAVANYENDTSHPKETVLYQLFQALSVDANFLFQDALPASSPSGEIGGGKSSSAHNASDKLEFTLRERRHLQNYRLLSDYSRDTIDYLTERELKAAAGRNMTNAGPGRVRAVTATSSEANIETDNKNGTVISAASIRKDTSDILKIYPYLSMTASAGFSTYSEDIPEERLQAPLCRSADFIIGVSGDSMLPLYRSGDLLYVARTSHIQEGEIGIFSKNGEFYVKKAGKDRLLSLNPAYPDIMDDDGTITAVGRVLGQVDLEKTLPVD